MIELSKCNKLIDDGFSLITVGENKIPNYTWQKYQSEQITKQELQKRYNYKGGYFYGEPKKELPATKNIGIVTGYDYLEVIDVDLKVFSTAKEKKEFYDEYLNFLKDNILDFEDKFVIYKTKSEGYHFLYKSKRCEGNSKLSKLKGHKEAVLETRGVGGYIFLYDGKNVGKKTYKDVQFISDEDRQILWQISKSYNYIEPVKEIIPPKTKKRYSESENKTWDDYNNKNSILDIISSEFDIVRNLKNKYVIKRKGAQSPHSGYVFKDTNTMYLFSTGTVFDAEKLYTPFSALCCLKYNNDFSLTTLELYKDGYGDRLKLSPIIEKEEIIIPKEHLVFPIDVFPQNLQKYISVCNKTLNNSLDYMGCSMLFLTSIIIGNSIIVEVKKGWKETANLWLALIGKAGVGKTPSINSITFPLENLNNKEIKSYIKNYEKFEHYTSLDKQEKNLSEEIKKPRKTQFIVNDITLEALVELHYENKNGIGVNKDELAGWFKDMNKYRQGSDLEHWLSSWSGKQINMNRKTAKSAFVQRAFIPVLGGIQPSIMDNFYTEENKSSGFLDRMLFSYPVLKPVKYSDSEMKQEYLEWYENYIITFYQTVKDNINYTEDNEIEPHIATFDKEAKKEWIRIHDDIINLQNSDAENEYMKSMLPKQLSYIPRFALMINILKSMDDTEKPFSIIDKDSILKAEKLSNYFIAMAKKIKTSSTERNSIKTILSENKGKSDYDKFVSIYSQDNTISKTELAEILNKSRQSIYRYIKQYEK